MYKSVQTRAQLLTVNFVKNLGQFSAQCNVHADLRTNEKKVILRHRKHNGDFNEGVNHISSIYTVSTNSCKSELTIKQT